jgi:hypothetical protein
LLALPLFFLKRSVSFKPFLEPSDCDANGWYHRLQYQASAVEAVAINHSDSARVRTNAMLKVDCAEDPVLQRNRRLILLKNQDFEKL